jgi:ssDNA-binding replication factor A large subunit
MRDAEEARNENHKKREKWGRSLGRKGGKSKGKGKDGKGKGKGKTYRVKKTVGSEEDRAAALEKLEKRLERTRTASIREMHKAEAPIKLTKPKFVKISVINPDSKGLNLMVKAVKCTPVEGSDDMWEAVVGDETGIVTVTVRSKAQADICKTGESLRIQNARVQMVKGFIRVSIDKWAVIKTADAPSDVEPNAKKDISATEYELS